MKPQDINSTVIARLAGVSRSTVSRVINNYPNVPPETREKVQRVIDEYNYSPIASGRMLAGKNTETIGLFMIDEGQVSEDLLSSLMIVSVIEHASARGYHVLTDIVRPGPSERVRAVKHMFAQRRIDAGLFIGAANDEPFVEELIAAGHWVGLVDHDVPGREEPNRVVVNYDNLDGMRQAIRHLAGLGHRRIGFIAGDPHRLSGRTKREAFETAMREAGLEIERAWVLPGSFSEKGGYTAMTEFLRSGRPLPTAIVAANDSIAFGAIAALREAGRRVPEDVSFVGFDDHALSARFQPALTTARVDVRRMLGYAVDGLIDRVDGRGDTPRRTEVGYELVVRQSCRRA